MSRQGAKRHQQPRRHKTLKISGLAQIEPDLELVHTGASVMETGLSVLLVYSLCNVCTAALERKA